MRIKRAFTLASVGIVTSILVLLTAIGVYADVSGPPDESISPPVVAGDGLSPGEGASPDAANASGDAASGLLPAGAGAAIGEGGGPSPPGPDGEGDADARSRAAHAAAECDRRLAANESVFVDALETGEGAAFHCTTTCTQPSVDLKDSRARNVADLQAEVDTFVTTAESTADKVADEFCLTESGYGQRKVEPWATQADPFLPADSGLQDSVVPTTDGPSAAAGPAASSDAAPTSTTTGSAGDTTNEGEAGSRDPDEFIPRSAFDRDGFPRV